MNVLENLLRQWTDKRDLAPSRRDDDGKHFYVFDGEFEVALSQLGNAIYLETELSSLPARRDEAEATLERLLKIQLARQGAGTLTLKPDQDQLLLFGILRADRLNALSFEAALGDFVNTAAFWAEKLESAGDGRAVNTGPAAPQIVYP